MRNLVPKELKGIESDDIKKLHDLFDLIKVDLALEPKETEELALQ